MLDGRSLSAGPSAVSPRRVGVFVGMCNHDFGAADGGAAYGPYSTSNLAAASAANIVSRAFDLGGPSQVVVA